MPILQTILLYAPILLFSVVAHEIAHGRAALWQGDRTALELGRLSWNPVRHIDPFLTILLPILTIAGSTLAGGRPLIFGGAKPVPVNPANYRQPRLGDIVVSLAGVATNAVVGVGCVLMLVLTGLLGRSVPAFAETLGILQAMLSIGVWTNAVLIAFNLLPIPPLDGSHVFKYLLPRALAVQYMRLSAVGLVLLIVLLNWGERVLHAWMAPMQWAAITSLRAVDPWILSTTGQWLR